MTIQATKLATSLSPAAFSSFLISIKLTPISFIGSGGEFYLTLAQQQLTI